MPTLHEQLAEGALYKMLPQWRQTMRIARADIEEMLCRCKKPYVALSWGKQSIVMAHMVYTIAPYVPCVHLTGEDAELIGNYKDVSAEFLSRWPVPYTEWPRGDKLSDAIAEFDAANDYTGVFVGLSAFESKGRKFTILKSDNRNILRRADGRLRCCPLANWGIRELAAYISQFDIPLLAPYLRYGLDIRTSTGCREGGRTEGAIDLMPNNAAAEMRRRWRERAENRKEKESV
jgi:3'-phosphoadenosine 5'-phosphosulfate sulfotransferase (PAPS reductase)/FAD synthetase